MLRCGVERWLSYEVAQFLVTLVADGSLYAAVEHVYPLEQFKEAFTRSLRSHRGRQDPVPIWPLIDARVPHHHQAPQDRDPRRSACPRKVMSHDPRAVVRGDRLGSVTVALSRHA